MFSRSGIFACSGLTGMRAESLRMDERGESPQGGRNRAAKATLVIGIGASAGSMNSIERFFSRISLDSQQAIVLVLQHREAFDESWLRGVLPCLNGTRLAVPRDGAAIEGNTIYLCGADAITTLQGDRF